MNGKTVSLEKLAGKYVLSWIFWGAGVALAESHPHLKELYEKYKKQVIL